MIVALLSELQMKARGREGKHEKPLLYYRTNKIKLNKKHVTEAIDSF
jgi:hypothetical protein